MLFSSMWPTSRARLNDSFRSKLTLQSSEDTAADVTARAECQAHFGYDTWFAGHRNGESGLNNPNTEDIAFYKESIQWIQSQIESDGAYLTDDTRFWVDVTPI